MDAELTYQWEAVRDVFAAPNLWDLLNEHYTELNVSGCPLAPDFERFGQLEDLGIFKVWTARSGETLAGYIGWFIQPHIHYSRNLHAVEDLFMLSAPYRKGLAGYRMWKGALRELQQMGVTRVVTHCKVHFEAERGGLRKFFERLGFAHTDDLWMLNLETWGG